MIKKQFMVPQVFLTSAELNDVGTGSNLGGFSIRPVPMSFGEWTQSRFVADYDSNPGVDFDDYSNWFAKSGFGEDTWTSINPGTAMTGENK